jgi:hypothetical protein
VNGRESSGDCAGVLVGDGVDGFDREVEDHLLVDDGPGDVIPVLIRLVESEEELADTVQRIIAPPPFEARSGVSVCRGEVIGGLTRVGGLSLCSEPHDVHSARGKPCDQQTVSSRRGPEVSSESPARPAASSEAPPIRVQDPSTKIASRTGAVLMMGLPGGVPPRSVSSLVSIAMITATVPPFRHGSGP